MKGLFQTILAVLFGLAFEEFYSETALPEESLFRVLSALPIVVLPIVFVEVVLWRARESLRGGRALDTQKFAQYVAAAPLPLYTLVVFACRWPAILVPLALEGAVLADHMVVLAPYFVIQALCLLCAARLRRPLQIHEGVVRSANLGDVAPVLREHLRQLGLLLVPLFVLIFLFDLVSDTGLRPYFRRIPLLSAGFLLLLFTLLVLIFPEVFRVSMNLRPLVSGAPLRLKLDELSRRLSFACRAILYWPTSRPVFNALIVGVVPRLRYVVLTEELCKRLTLDEIQAVYSHEVGHGKRAHALYYLLLSLTFVAILLPLGDWAGQEIVYLSNGRLDATLATMLFVYLPAFALYWKVALDALSKRFELESDVFGVEAIRDPVTFITTLEKVARLARLERGKATMRHFSIEGRVDFLRRAFVEGDAALLVAFRERIRRLRRGIVVSSTTVLSLAFLWLAYQSLHGFASLSLDRDHAVRAARIARALLIVHEDDVLAKTILSEAELCGGGVEDESPKTWGEVMTSRPELRPAQVRAVIEELRAGWLRAILRERRDIGREMLDRLRAFGGERNNGYLAFDPNLAEECANFDAAMRALDAENEAAIEALVEGSPRWLRRPDMRELEHYLANWLASRK